MAELVVTGTDASDDGARAPYLRWFRATAVGVSLVFLIFAVWALQANQFWPKGADYVSFWAAGRLALAGHAELAYDTTAHAVVELTAGHARGLLPFAYPPPFLAVVAPAAVFGYAAAFCVWVAATGAFYAWAARRVVALPYAFAMPPAYINLRTGQTGFLMTGIFVAGLTLIEANPWLAGAILGLMLFKPQLALLLPIAMLAGREWRVIGGAILSVCALLLLGLLLFGWSSYRGFFEMMPQVAALLRDGRLPSNALASAFALARSAGLPQSGALLIHALVALAATVLTARAWWLRTDERVPILAAATMLIPPYIFTYDALVLIIPLGWMIAQRRYPFAIAAVWGCMLLPIIQYFTPLACPNLISLGAAICLWVLHSHRRSPRRKAQQSPREPRAPAEMSAS